MVKLRPYLLFFLFFLTSVHTSAQGFCPGLNIEIELGFASRIEASIERESLFYTFESGANIIWRFDVFADKNLRFRFYSPSLDKYSLSEDFFFVITSSHPSEEFSTAFWVREEGQYCIAVANTSNQERVDFHFTLRQLVSSGGRLMGTEGINSAGAYNTIGNYYYSFYNYEAAYESYQESILLNDRDAMVWSNLCGAAFQLGNYEAALLACNKSLELRPQNRYALDYRSITYNSMGRYEEANADCTVLQRLEPDNYIWPYAMGINYLFIGESEAALEQIENYADRAEEGYRFYWLGLAQLNAENYLDAAHNFEHSINQADNPPAFYFLFVGLSYRLAGYEKEAQAAFDNGDRQLESSWDSWMITRYNAINALIQGDFEAAHDHLDAVLTQTPFSHQVRNERLYLSIFTRLFPDEEGYAELLSWFNSEIGVE